MSPCRAFILDSHYITHLAALAPFPLSLSSLSLLLFNVIKAAGATTELGPGLGLGLGMRLS